MSPDRVEMPGVGVRDGGGRSFDRGFAGVLCQRIREHALLHRTQADDRERTDPDQQGRDHKRLAALAVHGIHSIRRDALAVTTKRGRPTNPSGTGRV